jgi:acetate kinase
MNVFVLNSGSSSLKFQVISTDLDRIKQHQDERICRGEVERIGGEAIVTFQRGAESREKSTAPLRDISAALDYVIRYIVSDKSGVAEIKSSGDIHAVGHRVVHGGETFSQSALIDSTVLQGIEDCIDLAPLHNPNNIKGIVAARELFGKDVPQVAVFDTSFHHTIPEASVPLRCPLSPLPAAPNPTIWLSRYLA